MLLDKITIKVFKDPNVFKDSTAICPEWGTSCESQCVYWHSFWLCGKDIEKQLNINIDDKLYDEYQKILEDEAHA